MLYITTGRRGGVGLFSYVLQVFSNLSSVYNTDDKLDIQYTEAHIRYLDVYRGPNMWNYYFEQPFKLDIVDYDDVRSVVFIENDLTVPLAFIPKQDQDIIEVGRVLCNKYIKVLPHILDKVSNFLEDNGLVTGEYFAIHRRATDHYLDGEILPLSVYFAEADKLFDRFDKCLLATDDVHTNNAFKERYGDKVYSRDVFRSDTKRGAHFESPNGYGYQLGGEVLVDSLLLASSGFLLRTVSNVSMFSLYYNPDLLYKNMDTHILSTAEHAMAEFRCYPNSQINIDNILT